MTRRFGRLANYINELLNVREYRYQEPVTDDELPDGTELVEDDSKGAVYLEYWAWNDECCSCMSGGEKHGPYKYRVTVTVIPSGANI